jgi:hypothetical protein
MKTVIAKVAASPAAVPARAFQGKSSDIFTSAQ